jgi:hypothetical protein
VDHAKVLEGTSVGRKQLELRSRGGRLSTTYVNCNQLEPYADTPLLEHAPYVREILRGLGAPIGSSLFARLDPGGKIKEHADGEGFALGRGHLIRVHIPIMTNDDVWYVIGGQRHMLRPGELWYGDFSKPHWGENRGKERRIYLMANLRLTAAVLKLFPEEYLKGKTLKVDPPVCAPSPELARGFSFELGGAPLALEPSIEQLPEGFRDVIRKTFTGRHEVRLIDGELWGLIEGRKTFLLVAEGPTRLRLVDQPGAVELEFVNGVPFSARLELYALGNTFTLPFKVAPLSALRCP